MTAVGVCKLSEIGDGEARAVRASGRDLLVIRRGDEVYALRDVCPHYGARLSGGVVTCARVAGEVGEYLADEEVPMLRCPWHNWEFDVRSGECQQDATKRVAVYATQVIGDEIVVEI